jgi:S1-C subfamily serine protease
VDVPATPEAIAVADRAFAELTPAHAPGTLSFWETFATRALEERVPALGLAGEEVALPAGMNGAGEQVAVRVRQVGPSGPLSAAGLKPGDLLLEVGGEPFFRGRGALTALHQWLIRELRIEPVPYSVVAWRDGRRVESSVRLKLGPYGEP